MTTKHAPSFDFFLILIIVILLPLIVVITQHQQKILQHAAGPTNFAYVCGTQICINGQVFRVHGATAYHEYNNPTTEIAHAQQLKLNTLEMSVYDNLSQVDAYLAAAKANNMHIILNLSVFGQQHGNSLDINTWKPYLDTIASKYANDPTLLMILIFGEPPNSTAAKGFFQSALAYLRSKDSNHIISTGGIGYIDFAGPLQTDWHAIMDDPNNQTCDVEVNSSAEETYSAPAVRDYCLGKGKPWFLSAWSSCTGTGDYNHRGSAAAVGAHAIAMYTLAKTAIGTDFWNLSTNPAEDCSPNDPSSLFFQTVQQFAPTIAPPSPTQPVATPTPPSGSVTFSVSLCPHGLGNCGDNVSAGSGGNTNPLHPTRTVMLHILNAQGQPIGNSQGTLRYTSASQNFQGSISIANLQTGSYLASVQMAGFLPKQLPGIITITQGQTVSLPSVSLVTGDINSDGQLDLLDYNILIGCFGAKANTSMCTFPTTSTTSGADMNDDGTVDGVDYNLFLRELSVQRGG